jgi:hypothetical protein
MSNGPSEDLPLKCACACGWIASATTPEAIVQAMSNHSRWVHVILVDERRAHEAQFEAAASSKQSLVC